MVRLVGWRGLGISPIEEQRVQALIKRCLDRVHTMLDDVVDVSIRVKQASRTGTKHRYDVHLSVLSAEHGYFHAKSTDWDARAAVHTVFESVLKQVDSKTWHAREKLYERGYPYEQPLLRL